LFLLAVARYFKDNEQAYALLSELEKTYAVVCEEFGVEPNNHTQLWNYAQFLSSMGALTVEVATTRGRSTQVSLSIPASELEKELSASLEVEKEKT
jgi:cell division control protein 6